MRPTSFLSFCPRILFYYLNSTDLFENNLICLHLLHQNVSFTRTGHIYFLIYFGPGDFSRGKHPSWHAAGDRFCGTQESRFSGSQPKGAAERRVPGGAPTMRAAALALLSARVWSGWVCAGCAR